MKHMNFPPVDGDEDLSQKIKSMGRVMVYSSESVRYDLQRNLLQIVETMRRTSPANLYHWSAFREVADMVVGQAGSAETLREALSRAAGQNPADQPLRKKTNILNFMAFKSLFNQRSGVDKFLTDRMLATRTESNELKLTAWGEYMLEHLKKPEGKHQYSLQDAEILRLPVA